MDAPAPAPGRRVAGRYLLRYPLGHGGMGTVWLADDELLQRPVAVKEVAPSLGLSDADQDRLRAQVLSEARAAARLAHPGSVRVYDVLDSADLPCIVMELLDGCSLAQLVRDRGRLPVREVAALGLALLDALAAAHAAGIVHRDIKPGNVVVTRDGRAILTDFGIATRTDAAPGPVGPIVDGTEEAGTAGGDAVGGDAGVVVGSPAYLAPERARGHRAGPASDIWSLGATLFTAVEGRPPFPLHIDPQDTLAAILEQDHQPFQYAGPLAPALTGLLTKDPARRLGTAAAVEALRAVVAAADAVAADAVADDLIVDRTYPAADEPNGDAPSVAGLSASGTYGSALAMGGRTAGLFPGEPTTDVAAPRGPWVEDESGPPEPPRRDGLAGRRRLPGRPGTPPRRRLTLRRAGWPVRLLTSRAGQLAAVVVTAAVAGTAVLVGGLAVTSPPRPAAAHAGATVGSPTGQPVGDPPTGAAPSRTAPSGTAPSGAGTTPSGAGTTPSGAGTIPGGWRSYRAPEGWSIGQPPGWTTTRAADGTTTFRAAAASVEGAATAAATLTVARRTDAGTGSVLAAWRAAEPAFAARHAAYHRVAMAATTQGGHPAADWELTYRDGATTVHVLERGLVAGGVGYVLVLQAPESSWSRVRTVFAGFSTSFTPGR